MRLHRCARNLHGIVVGLEQTIWPWTNTEFLRDVLLRKTAKPGMEAVDLPSKDFVTNDMPVWIESEFPADGLGNVRKKFVLADRSIFGHEARGVVSPKSQAQQVPPVAADRKPPKEVSSSIQCAQCIRVADIASAAAQLSIGQTR